MNAEQMQELMRRRPFEPFRILMRDGPAIEIRHPELHMVTRQTFVVGVPDHDLTQTRADHFVFVNWSSIDHVEPLAKFNPAL